MTPTALGWASVLSPNQRRSALTLHAQSANTETMTKQRRRLRRGLLADAAEMDRGG